MRMANCRFPRLTNAHGRDRHGLMQLPQNAQDTEMTPAMAVGVSKTLWLMEDLCEKDAVAPKPGKRGPYKRSEQTYAQSKRDLSNTISFR
jgi:hypothetical protein